MSNETTSGAAPSERARSSSGRKEGSRRDRGLINPAVSRPTSWWLATLRRRAAAMYEEPVADLKAKVEFSSEAEQRACIAFFNAAYRAEESGLQQAHRLAQRFERTDPELAECLVLYGNEEGWHRELLTEFLAHIGGAIRPMGRVTGTFYNTYDRAEHMESIMLTNLMFETIGATTYRLALGRVRQPAIRAMLTILTRDESFHVPLNVHFLREALARSPASARPRLQAIYKLLFAALLGFALNRYLPPDSLRAWGWRIPFWVSIIMVAISIVIRMRMKESPLFAKVKAEGKISTNPLKESFGHKLNFKFVLLALFGATMGQGVVWYTGQFYALSFIQTTLSVDVSQASKLIMWALLFATPFFVVFGWLSDRIGRKWIMLIGMLVAIVSYRFIYSAMYDAGSVKMKKEVTAQTVTDVKMSADAHVAGDSIKTTNIAKVFEDGTTYKEEKKETIHADISKADPAKDVKITKTVMLDDGSFWKLVFLVFIQVLFVTMVYGPIAAFLVELFPTRIRYTSLSLPYNISNGLIGGFQPFVSFAIITATGDIFAGLWYPIAVAAICFVIGALLTPETFRRSLHDYRA